MYLISVYFDERTNQRIQKMINTVAEKTGNRFMTEGKVPPHLTVSAFETLEEEEVKTALYEKFTELKQGNLTWCSSGAFFPYVIYLTPVLNAYLHGLSSEIYKCLSKLEGVEINRFYKPFQWMPHATIGKKLSEAQMRTAFQILQENFRVFEGEVVQIGLAKPNPHRDLMRVELKERESI